jgi:hypothetical protein
MNNKIEVISKFIEYLSTIMPQESMLLVTGDHGMRDDGNHGGNNDE